MATIEKESASEERTEYKCEEAIVLRNRKGMDHEARHTSVVNANGRRKGDILLIGIDSAVS